MAESPVGRLAGFWVRFASWVLDGLLYGLVYALFAVPGILLIIAGLDDCRWVDDDTENQLELVCPSGSVEGGTVAAGIALLVIGFLLVFVLYVRALGRGQSWAMRITRIRLVRAEDGGPLGFGLALGRTLFASFISGPTFHLGYLWAAWEPEKRTWHDMIVKSYVVQD